MKLRRVLVAGRGASACRVLRTAQRLGLDTVAVCSAGERDALRARTVEEIIAAARASGADAVHPGDGVLGGNADFAQAVADAGLTWIGPGPHTLRALGSKARAKEHAYGRGIPCLPGYQGPDQSDERLLAAARDIGFPLMVKASAGRNGCDMRLVTNAEQLAGALQAARAEAQSAFGDGELVLERALPRPRHIEVQVIADLHGRCLHLGERDCSVQHDRHRLLEEAPGPAVDAPLRERMGQHAVELARAAGFTGVGAVEFLLDEHGRFWLTDMDTRAQAAPAVTEMVSGLDLVEWQLRIAGGDRLPYRQEHLNVQGHAIEVHLCAEDDAFLPQAGRVQVLRPPLVNEARGPGARLRFDHELREGLELGPGGDPRLGTLVAHAATREQAIARLATALDALQVLGLATNRRLLAACLRHREFAAGEVNVDFLALHAGAMRRELAAEERRAVPEAALAVLLPQGPAPALAWPFPRPWRVRHRGEVLDVTVCEAEAGPVPPVQVAAVGPGRWHVQSGCVDLFLEDASYCPP